LQINGSRSPYPFNLDILDLFDDHDLAVQTFARPARLIDLTIIPDKVIKQYLHTSMLEYLQNHIRDPEFTAQHALDLAEIILNVLDNARKQQLYINDATKNNVTKYLHYAQHSANITDEKQFREILENIDYIKKENIMGPIPRKYIKQGKNEGKIEVAKSMLQEGSDIKFIIKVTGLPEEEIEKLN
jgi:predicted transposase/invertase (TIGR01784 family)